MHIFSLLCQLIPQAHDFKAIRQFMNSTLRSVRRFSRSRKNLKNIPKISVDATRDEYFSSIKLRTAALPLLFPRFYFYSA